MRKRNNIILLFVMLLSILRYTAISAAAFSHTAELINVPVAKVHDPGEFEFGMANAYYKENGSLYAEFDYKANYSLSKQLQMGATIINSSTAVGNITMTYLNLKDFADLKCAAGLYNIMGKSSLSSFDKYPMSQNTNLSPFFVNSIEYKDMFNLFDLGFHLGYGKKQFESVEGGFSGVSGLNGLFAGIETSFGVGRLMFEFDGKDFNIGTSLKILKNVDINMAITEIFQGTTGNPNYNNAPTRFFTFAFRYHKNIFDNHKEIMEDKVQRAESEVIKIKTLRHRMEVEKRDIEAELAEVQQLRRELNKDVGSLKRAMRNDLRFLDTANLKDKDKKLERYLGISSELGEQVLKYYYESFEHYYQKRYISAIELLNKALILDPYVPMLYIRLGTIYFELDMYEKALENWKKAQEIEPNNAELNRLIRKVERIYI